ncbi:hypothetical protein F441_11827 [Phytophthora nicotianae CJ01A1]|uniref:Uncharacterized protein n=2 Tax=Phytophthora nicotianae TaxID=4792 RepID=V9EV70_PHYNI|nr:hypothetical protein F443_11868 [Phytophthora nicotianae P1569]ETP12895.1 hypothetical protein F441_11827 [Phytophthora nicotianae CJ01A1]
MRTRTATWATLSFCARTLSILRQSRTPLMSSSPTGY